MKLCFLSATLISTCSRGFFRSTVGGKRALGPGDQVDIYSLASDVDNWTPFHKNADFLDDLGLMQGMRTFFR